MTATETRRTSADRDAALLARLGLGPGASNGEIEAAHDAVVDYVNRAPGSLRTWARIQLSDADEAYALLNGSATEPGDWLDGAEAAPVPARPARREARRASSPAPVAVIVDDGRIRTIRRLGLAAGALAAVAVIAFVGYKLGDASVPGLTGTPAPQASASALDQTKVAAAMQKLQANANDLVALQDLANLYYAAGDYATSNTWLKKILAIDPKNVAALLGSGAASFNLGDLTGAETAWKAVLAIDTKNVEAHYDLGFMYLSENPPQMDLVRAEWNQVVALAPDSDIAKTVATHLATLNASPAPSAAPASPVPSPVASPG